MDEEVENLAGKTETVLVAAVAACGSHLKEAADFLDLAEAVADSKWVPATAAGDARPTVRTPWLLARGAIFALASPLNRPRIRRDAFRSVSQISDEFVGISTMAVGFLTADLLRFDLEQSLHRLHQTLLEDSPTALLERLVPVPESDTVPRVHDPSSQLQNAITAVSRAKDVEKAIILAGELSPEIPAVAQLAGIFAGAASALSFKPAADSELVQRAKAIAARLATRAQQPIPEPARTNA